MRRPVLTIVLVMALLHVDALAQKRKDLHGKTPDAGIKIEHPVSKEGKPIEHAAGTSKKAKLEQGTRDAHPPKEKARGRFGTSQVGSRHTSEGLQARTL